jgi:hypothetical protein
MIFIVAVGLGLAVARPAISLIIDAVRSESRWRFQTIAGAVALGRMCNIVMLNFLFFLVPACVIVRLKRPHLPLGSMISQPGFAACAAPVLAVLVLTPISLIVWDDKVAQVIATVSQAIVVGAAPLAWIVLIAMRRWNAEPSWIDRLGRIFGLLGMLVVPAHMVLIRLPY